MNTTTPAERNSTRNHQCPDNPRHRTDLEVNASFRLATRRNADAEGVSSPVDLHTADMTALPFMVDTFDLVVSNVAIHNVKAWRRDTAIDEALRVLRQVAAC
jgi:ubiquinone/menaquinone biosynthesis C-methylase UbiE